MRSRLFLALISAFAASVALAVGGAVAQSPTKPAAAKDKKAAAPKKDEVAAVVNGQRIMLSELLARLQELEINPAEQDEAAAHVLDGLIDDILIVQFLNSRKIPFDANTVQSQIAEMRAEVEKGGLQFGEALAKLGLTEQKVRGALIAEAQWQHYLSQRVSDKQLTEHFTKYREFFDGSEVRASHILVEVPDGADAAARAAAKSKADRVRKELAAGADFAATAKKYSDCPSKEQGGDVDWFARRGKMVEPFAKAAFALRVGEISPVVESQFGYHIIKVTGRKAGKSLNLADTAMKTQLLDAVGEPIKESIAAQQRKTAKIEIAPGVEAAAPKAKTATGSSGNRVTK